MKTHLSKRIVALLLTLIMVLSLMPMVFAEETPKADGVVVLYTNDVHCGVDQSDSSIGIAGLAKIKKDMQETNKNVTLVDNGDFVQGELIGTVSKGEYLVQIMNYLGYDYGTFGNHEFDYTMPQLKKLVDMANMTYLSCNFKYIGEGENPNAVDLASYAIKDYDGLKVAYVGITTPESLVKSTPTYFQNENGEWLYTFCNDTTGEALYTAVQTAVDAARAEGATIVVALAHLGTNEQSAPWRSTDVIANTTGINVMLDGHSHSVIDKQEVANKNGETVLLSSTGTKLANVGKLTITKDGAVDTELIAREEVDGVDADTQTFLEQIEAEFNELQNTVVAHVDYDLLFTNPEGVRMVRMRETNLGDVCADAYRTILGADIAFVNGGGVRANIAAGDVTYKQIIAVHPYGNMACMVKTTGQQILDALEMSARNLTMDENGNLSGENGGFLQVSGLKYTIDTSIPSSVVVDESKMFVEVAGARRVKDVQVLQADGSYAPIDPNGEYKLASHNYMLKESGDGLNMFKNDELLLDEVKVDNQVLIEYMSSDAFKAHDYSNWKGEGRIKILPFMFTDVTDHNEFFFDFVYWAYNHDPQITAGTGDGTTFSPYAPCTREQVVTFLWATKGRPNPGDDATQPFTDVGDDAYYTDPVRWAYNSKPQITAGIGGGLFGTGLTCTRGEFVTFLWTAAGKPDPENAENIFTDVHEGEYWYDAVRWAYANGITVGVGNNRFGTYAECTRGEVVTFLYKFVTWSEQADPENPNPEDPNPEDPNPEDPNPENPNPEDPNPEDPNPEDPNPEDPNPEDPNPEDPNPEDPNPEDPEPQEQPIGVAKGDYPTANFAVAPTAFTDLIHAVQLWSAYDRTATTSTTEDDVAPMLSIVSPVKPSGDNYLTEGNIYMTNIDPLFPENNLTWLVQIEMNGDELKQWLEYAASLIRVDDEGLLYVPDNYLDKYDMIYGAGFHYDIDASKSVGSRVVGLTYNGEDVKANQKFTVVINSERCNDECPVAKWIRDHFCDDFYPEDEDRIIYSTKTDMADGEKEGNVRALLVSYIKDQTAKNGGITPEIKSDWTLQYSTDSTVYYTKVTSTSDLTEGQYLIVFEADQVAMDGSLTDKLDAGNNVKEIKITDNGIAATNVDFYFTYDGNGTFTSASGLNLGHSQAKNGLDGSGTNTVSIDANGNAVIKGSGGYFLRFNSSTGDTNYRFRYYAEGKQQPITLYKLSQTIVIRNN